MRWGLGDPAHTSARQLRCPVGVPAQACDRAGRRGSAPSPHSTGQPADCPCPAGKVVATGQLGTTPTSTTLEASHHGGFPSPDTGTQQPSVWGQAINLTVTQLSWRDTRHREDAREGAAKAIPPWLVPPDPVIW